MQSVRRKLEQYAEKHPLMRSEKGQIVQAGTVVISLFIIVAVASLILMFTTAVNTKTFSSIAPIVANPGNANIGADINASIEAGFDATNTVAGFQGVVFLALLAAVIISIFVGFLGIAGGGSRGVNF